MGVLQSRRALVTGGASGIGFATAKRFVDEGASVVIVDVNAAGGKEKAAEAGAEFVQADVSESAGVAEAFRRANELLGGLDIAYMNAGVTTGEGDVGSLTDEQYFRILNINVNGVVFGVREAVRLMDGSGGSILATASIAGLMGHSPDPIYTLTKHAVVGLVRACGPALRDRGITLNAICPGITETPLVGAEAAKMLRASGFPLIPPEGIANACVMAITDGGSGKCWVIQPGREPEPYGFRGIPGPRSEGDVGKVPPGVPNVS